MEVLSPRSRLERDKKQGDDPIIVFPRGELTSRSSRSAKKKKERVHGGGQAGFTDRNETWKKELKKIIGQRKRHD